MQATGEGLNGSVVLQEGLMPTEKAQPERLSSPNVVRVKQVVRQLTYVDQEHYRVTFEYFNVLRDRGDFCDVSFTVDKAGRLLHAHKLVLASSSPYFESLFSKGGLSGPIMIDGVDGRTLEQLILFAYTSEVAINEKNVRKLLRASQKLQFDGVMEACYRYCKTHIDISNCVQMWKFAEKHKCEELADAAARCIQLNFLEISRRQEFLELSTEQIVKLTMMGELVIEKEEDVYLAVINWARHDPQNKKTDLAQAIKNIRFACMDNEFVMDIINTEPLIKDDISCLEVLCDALGPEANESWPTDRMALLSNRPSLNLYETVEIARNGNPLGLDIMGGTDRPTHIFHQGDKPGLFVIAVVPGGVAEKCRQIKCGDRILAVNGVDITEASHEKAIRTIQSAPDPLLLYVKHETPPPGLKELELTTTSGDGFGFSLGGGVGAPSVNPVDPNDHGIFITEIDLGGIAATDGRLTVGTRVLQLNSISLLEKTLTESMMILDKVSETLNLLVCSGYDQGAVSSRHKAPSPGHKGPSPRHKASSDAHPISNGSVASDKTSVISRNKSSMKKKSRHFDIHSTPEHLLNGN